MPEINWDKADFTDRLGRSHNLNDMTEKILQECSNPLRNSDKKDNKQALPLALDMGNLSDCISNSRAAAKEKIERDEANTVLERLPNDLIKAAKEGKQSVSVAVFDKPEIPAAYSKIVDHLKQNGYKTELLNGVTQEPVKIGQKYPGPIQIYVLEAKFK